MSLLSSSDCKRIEDAIARVEEQSAAEFVVVVVPRSSPYDRWRALVAMAWALVAAIAYFPHLPFGAELWGVFLQLPIGLGVWALFGIPALHRLLIPSADAEQAVRSAAFRVFAERGIHQTRDHTGMLLLISELEHRAVLLGDTGIDTRVGGSEQWQRHVDHLIQRIRAGRAGEGVVEVIDRLAALLGEKVPVQPRDENELPNAVVRET